MQTYNTPAADVDAYLKEHQPETIRARYANHEALKEHPEVARFLEWDNRQKVGTAACVGWILLRTHHQGWLVVLQAFFQNFNLGDHIKLLSQHVPVTTIAIPTSMHCRLTFSMPVCSFKPGLPCVIVWLLLHHAQQIYSAVEQCKQIYDAEPDSAWVVVRQCPNNLVEYLLGICL